MADINVERGGPTLWPWILGLLVMSVLIWALAEIFGADPGVESDSVGDSLRVEEFEVTEPIAAPPPPPSVAPVPGPDTLGGMADTLNFGRPTGPRSGL